MATFSLADLSASMPQFYRELVPQIQRKAVIARLLQWKTPVDPKGPAWDVTFAGQAAGEVNPDGGSFVTAASDPQVAATLGWGAVSAPIKVTTKAEWVGKAMPGDYSWLQNLIGRNAKEAAEALVKLINQRIYNGAGTGNQITGLSTAITNSGIYANINSSTYAGWKCSATSNNSGTPTNITLAQIKSDLATIASNDNNSMGRPDVLVMRSAPFNTLMNAFDAYTQLVYTPTSGTLSMPVGSTERVSMNPNVLSTAGGKILRTGFRVMRWESEDLWIVEDPDCTHTAQTNATATGYYLNTSAVHMEYLPPAGEPQYGYNAQIQQGVEQDLGPIANLQFEIRPRGRTTFADELDLLTMHQLVVTSRAACGYRTDIQ